MIRRLAGIFVFPKFSGNHGWQWWRELYLNDSSVWTYDLASNQWRNRRPVPAPRLAGLRCAAWDSHHRVVVVFGGEGSREGTLIYDPWRNEWRWPKPDSQPPFRSGGNLAYDAKHKLHILFGAQFSNDPHTWAYSVSENKWFDRKPASLPPTDRNDAVLTYDPIHAVVLALVKVTRGKDEKTQHEVQTWAYDTGANKWTRMKPKREPDSAGNRTRNLIFAPELNLAILENCTGRPREQQVWTYRFSNSGTYRPAKEQPRPCPPIIEDVVVSVRSRKKVQVRWKAPRGAELASYHVERAVVEVWSEDQLVRLKRNTPPLNPPSVGAIRSIGPFQKLTEKPIAATEFLDTDVDLGEPIPLKGKPIFESSLHAEHLDRGGKPYPFAVYAYRVRGISADGKISGPSPAVLTIPSSPQYVFSKEDGNRCHLKWAANPEDGIVGYRVYRMDGRWSKDPVSRLTAKPISTTRFTDSNAGKPTRRYYIVAVDALGQEGFPSSPVWYRREWAAYYKPFVGEWHQ
ncbi:MAG: hypothetical protein KatS3mg105_1009 [Gemmatales bacterium]|nr:MAG: hypothetical protein KatS3mg105_1009 [Gemmatales bacterium]